MAVILGVDGGGTNTRAAVVQDGRVLAHGHSGSIKRLRVGAEAAETNLRALLRDLYGQAGVSGVAAGSVGVASCSLPGTVEWITAVLKDFNVERIDVVGDEVIALDAAFQGGPGILQIAGTGSNTIGRAPDGSRESAGGYSSRLGDVVQMGDSTPGPDFAALAPAINELAEAGDPVAVGVLKQAASDLVDFVLLVRKKLKANHPIEGEVPVAWTGGAIANMRLVREGFFAGLKAGAPAMPVFDKETVSLEGALWRAEQLVKA
jgi:glucosamine kinase